MVWDTLDRAGDAARTRQQVADSVGVPPPRPAAGVFENFAPSAGNYFMRSMAEAGRAASMAFAAVPVALDRIVEAQDMTYDRGQGNLSDRYFRWHDETFNRAVDYWTPKPQEVGAAGQVVGQVLGGVVQFLANPALLVGTSQMSASEDLVRQGVDADAAILAGDVAGIASAVGIALPAALGKTLAARVATGAAGNLAVNVPEAAVKREIVRAAGAPDAVAQQFDPFDTKARAVDILLGAAFGAKAHWDARLTPAQRDAMAVQAQALHLEEASSPGRPATPTDLTATVTATRAAMDQMLRGEPVQVADLLRGVQIEDSPAKAAARAEIEAVSRETLAEMPSGEPIAMPRMADYQGPHRPMTVEGGAARLDDLVPAFGEDIYGKDALQFFGTGDTKLDAQTIKVLMAVRGKPDMEIAVYRAVPKDATDALLRAGDWVTVNKAYAKQHGDSTLDGDYKIITQKVRAGDLTTNADSFHEQGYYPADSKIESQNTSAEGGPKVEVTPEQARAAAILERYPDLKVAIEAADGNPKALDAAAFLRDAEAEAASAQTTGAALLRTAASCLLGAI